MHALFVMSRLSVVLHPTLPPGVAAWVCSIPNLVIQAPAHNAGDSPAFGARWGAVFRHNLAALAALDGSVGWRNAVVGPGATP